jgi:hypothetical protein
VDFATQLPDSSFTETGGSMAASVAGYGTTFANRGCRPVLAGGFHVALMFSHGPGCLAGGTAGQVARGLPYRVKQKIYANGSRT